MKSEPIPWPFPAWKNGKMVPAKFKREPKQPYPPGEPAPFVGRCDA